MTDKEMLELAAKAAGVEPQRLQGDGPQTMVWIAETERWVRAWNPLTDDGDALRLAVKVRIAVDPWGAGACAVAFCPGFRRRIQEPHYGDDPSRATRRAIVRAAAKIGKSMETK